MAGGGGWWWKWGRENVCTGEKRGKEVERRGFRLRVCGSGHGWAWVWLCVRMFQQRLRSKCKLISCCLLQ